MKSCELTSVVSHATSTLQPITNSFAEISQTALQRSDHAIDLSGEVDAIFDTWRATLPFGAVPESTELPSRLPIEVPKSPVYKTALDKGEVLYLGNPLQPIETRYLKINGATQEVAVSGYIRLHNRSDETQLWLTTTYPENPANPDDIENVTALEIDDSGDLPTVVSQKTVTPDGNPVLFYNDESYDTLTLNFPRAERGRHKGHWSISARAWEAVDVTVAEASNPSKDRPRQKWLPRFAKLALAGMLAGPVGGQLVDFAENHNPYYNAAGDTRAMLSGSNLDPSSITNVSQIMHELQTGDTQAILESAEKYAEEYPDQIISAATRQKYINEVNDASSNANTINALDDFMHLYGKEAGWFKSHDQVNELKDFDENKVSVNDTKAVARAAINAYSVLPKSIVENANFQALLLSGDSGEKGGVYTDIIEGNGYELPFVGLAVSSQFSQVMDSAYSLLDGDGSGRWVALHELGHARQSDQLVYQSKSGGIWEVAKYWGAKWIDSPDFTSMYVAGADNQAEPDADTFAGTVSPDSNDSNGLFSPRSYLEFHSQANKKMLVDLASIDSQASHGAAAWLIAHNERLMGADTVMQFDKQLDAKLASKD